MTTEPKAKGVDVLKTMGSAATTLEVNGYLTTASNLAEARAAVAELIVAVREDFAMRAQVPKYTPADLQNSCERVWAALNRIGGEK